MAHHILRAREVLFRFQTFCIDKSELLGRGSYGAVYKAKCDQLPCAAKVLHPTIVDPSDPGAAKIMDRFRQECVFLENIQHPNIVQFLGITQDPESRLPVLLMEKLDESLTKMLEHSRQSLAYCVQVDICHDISLAVAYLHSNDIIHRDLSSNNVLIIAGRRAKVTDFGMSKLTTAASSATPLTTCPGMQVFMPPEALKEPPTYKKKLDCFSEGVLMIQVCTRLWPDPGPRTERRCDPNSPTGEVEVPVLETERRKNHIKLIEYDHPLLPIANDCLEYQDDDRPSCKQLCERIAALKESRKYRRSLQNLDEVQDKDNQIILLAQQLQEKDTTISEKDNQLQQCQQQLDEQEVVTAEIQQTNHSLQRQVEQLQLQLSEQSLIPLQLPHHSQVDDRPHLVLTWRYGGKTPLAMCRGAAVVNGDVAYFMHIGGEVCSYNVTSNEWSKVAKCPYKDSSLAIVNGLLVAIGGFKDINEYDTYSNKLLILPGYKETFPCMPTKRRNTTAVASDDILIVAGGRTGPRRCDCIDKVEVMDTKTKVWSPVAKLCHPYTTASGVICGDQFYMLGGTNKCGMTKSVLICSLANLLQSSPLSPATSVWRNVAEAPAYNSTCATVNGKLLLIGGCDGNRIPMADIHIYNSTFNSWDHIGAMPTRKYRACVAVLPTGEVMVVGGKNNEQGGDTDLVEVAAYV